MIAKSSLSRYINWVEVMKANRCAGGHYEIMGVIFDGSAEVIASVIEHDYQGAEIYAYQFRDRTVVLVTDYFGSCSGRDSYEDASDKEIRLLVTTIVNNARMFSSIEEAAAFCRKADKNAEDFAYWIAEGMADQLEALSPQLTLHKLHAMVWSYRERLSSKWPTPNRSDSLAFAFTEIGEAVDAELRQDPTYNRNHNKSIDIDSELADCLIMLLTAMGKSVVFDDIDNCMRHAKQRYLLEVVYAVTMAYYECDDNQWLREAIAALLVEWSWASNVYDIVKGRLDRIEKRVSGGANV